MVDVRRIIGKVQVVSNERHLCSVVSDGQPIKSYEKNESFALYVVN